jgi:hypothetical protein
MKNRVIIDFQSEEQALAFFDLFDKPKKPTFKGSHTATMVVMSAVDVTCIEATEEMPEDDFYHIELA